jgi:hypothetical protein
MAVSCPTTMAMEHTQNKAQFGWKGISALWDLTGSGIAYRETGQSMLL